jgi:hypothetical protein
MADLLSLKGTEVIPDFNRIHRLSTFAMFSKKWRGFKLEFYLGHLYDQPLEIEAVETFSKGSSSAIGFLSGLFFRLFLLFAPSTV